MPDIIFSFFTPYVRIDLNIVATFVHFHSRGRRCTPNHGFAGGRSRNGQALHSLLPRPSTRKVPLQTSAGNPF